MTNSVQHGSIPYNFNWSVFVCELSWLRNTNLGVRMVLVEVTHDWMQRTRKTMTLTRYIILHRLIIGNGSGGSFSICLPQMECVFGCAWWITQHYETSSQPLIRLSIFKRTIDPSIPLFSFSFCLPFIYEFSHRIEMFMFPHYSLNVLPT